MSMKEAIFSMMIEALENMDEAVEVSHDRYMRSHGKKARDTGQSGNWMFTHKSTGDVDYNDEKEIHNARGKFADAKKSAQQWAKQHGHRTVYVMEEVDQIDEEREMMKPWQVGEMRDQHQKWANHFKSVGNEEGYKAHQGVVDHIKKKFSEKSDRYTHGRDWSAKTLNKISEKAFKEHRPTGMKEEVEQIDELAPNTLHSYIKKSTGEVAARAISAVAPNQSSETKKHASKLGNRIKGITSASGRLADKANQNEEAEQIDELSKNILKKYRSAAWKSAGDHYDATADAETDGEHDYHIGKGDKRMKGYELATAKTGLKPHQTYVDSGINTIPNAKVKATTSKVKKEEAEQIDELSKKTLGSYVKKAGGTSLNSAGAHMADYGANSNQKSFKKGINRAKGVMRAADRLTKEEVELDEADAVVTHKWYSVKNWKDGSEHFDNLDNHLGSHSYKHPALGNTAKKRPDHHIGIPVKAKSAIAYMDKHASAVNEEVELDEGIKEKIGGIIRRQKEKEYPLLQNRRDVAADKAAKAYAKGDEKKGNRYMTWRANNMKKEEVELDEETMPGNVALRLVDRHQAAAFHHKKNGNMKGYAAHFKVAERIEDAVIRAGRDMPVKSKQLEAASDKAFKDHPHRVVKN